MTKWLIHTHPEMKEWMPIFDYMFQRGAVGNSNGITFVIHTRENGHNKPHLHARYQGKEVVVGIPDGDIISGNLPRKQLNMASDWVVSHSEYLKEQWDELAGGVFVFG